MSASGILYMIHKENLEIPIYKALSNWIIENRESWIDEAMKQEAIVRAVGKIAKNNTNKGEAIEGIKNLCGTESE